jgi:glycosyltransferase involved in cell wall biosynthesis
MNYKPELVFCAPVATVSGYGAHARDLLLSLIKMDKFRISVISINWGDTPMNALNPELEDDRLILDLVRNEPLSHQPDIWMQCTIPNEFQPVGKYNIGITAGIETDACSPEWIDGCNKMNLILVPSKHSKKVFDETSYTKFDKATNSPVGMLKLETPVEVLHEGIRLDIYNKSIEQDSMMKKTLDEIPENFCYLFVGHWLKGDFGQDRKDLSGLIYTFIETFAGSKNKPALVLKTSCGTFSVTDKSRVTEKINLIKQMCKKTDLPNIYILHGELTDNEMNSLYNHDKIKAFVSFTKGEGYGRPIAEFMTTGKPVIVSGWSGHVDFVNQNFHTHLKGELKPVHKSAVWETVINNGTSWFNVDYQDASRVLEKVYSNYTKYLQSAKLSVREIEKLWSYENMHNKFIKILDERLPKFAEKVSMNLPTLKKVSPINLEELK